MWWIPLLIIGWITFGILAGFIAINKGHSFLWFFVGILFGLIGVVVAIGLPDEKELESIKKQIKELKNENNKARQKWICNKCGTENDGNSIFCRECGQKKEAIKEADWICARCGNQNPDQDKFCGKCGASKEENRENPSSRDTYVCKKCGTEFPSYKLFCPQCGAKKETETKDSKR